MNYNKQLKYEGHDVYLNPWLERGRIIKTDCGNIIMRHYTAARMMLLVSVNEYTDVFEKLGLDDDVIDACVDSAIDELNIFINKMVKRVTKYGLANDDGFIPIEGNQEGLDQLINDQGDCLVKFDDDTVINYQDKDWPPAIVTHFKALK